MWINGHKWISNGKLGTWKRKKALKMKSKTEGTYTKTEQWYDYGYEKDYDYEKRFNRKYLGFRDMECERYLCRGCI